jgi:hypothetical protein
MKFLASLIALLFLCYLSHAQNSPPAMTNPYPMTGHPAQAVQQSLASEHSLLNTGGETSAQGERPLSDFYTRPEPTVSLGQIAREYRSGYPVKRSKITVIP